MNRNSPLGLKISYVSVIHQRGLNIVHAATAETGRWERILRAAVKRSPCALRNGKVAEEFAPRSLCLHREKPSLKTRVRHPRGRDCPACTALQHSASSVPGGPGLTPGCSSGSAEAATPTEEAPEGPGPLPAGPVLSLRPPSVEQSPGTAPIPPPHQVTPSLETLSCSPFPSG